MFNKYSETDFGVREPRVKGKVTKFVPIAKINVETGRNVSLGVFLEEWSQFLSFKVEAPICFSHFPLVSSTVCEIGMKLNF